MRWVKYITLKTGMRWFCREFDLSVTVASIGYFALGSSTTKVVPTFGLDSNDIEPPKASTMFLQMARPKPVPDDLVVKFGTNTRSASSAVMPLPLSVTDTRTNRSFASQQTSINP